MDNSANHFDGLGIILNNNNMVYASVNCGFIKTLVKMPKSLAVANGYKFYDIEESILKQAEQDMEEAFMY